jgi:ATP-dependent Clp protease ATP-binding subunit ClpC
MMGKELSASSKKALEIAQLKVKELKHNMLGTEHILLGLVIEEEGLAGKILRNRGLNQENVTESIISIVGEGSKPSNYITISPRSKNILEIANQYAAKYGYNYIETEHILTGMIMEGEGVAFVIMKEFGLTPEIIQSDLQEEYKETKNGSSLNKPESSKESKGLKTLEKYGKNLNEQAKKGKLDPVIGRKEEIERVIQVLSRRTKNNPVLIGEPGVGKTAIAEGLAQAIVERRVPEILKDKVVVTIDLAGMVAGSKYRGEFEERLKKVMEEIIADGNVIMFLDELHTLIGAGGAEGAIDAANILKPSLSRGEIQAIGATTLDEYKKHIEKDAALERRFQPIMIDEPTVEETIEILKGLRDKYEAHHKVKIKDEAIEAAAKLSHRYISDRFLPDKAIDLIDEASSRQRIKTVTAPPDLKDLEDELKKVSKEKQEAINNQKFEKAAELRDREKGLVEELENRKKSWKQQTLTSDPSIDYDDIAQIVSSWTGVPVTKMAVDESEKLLGLENILHKRVIGQEPAVEAVSKAIRRARVGLKDPKKPIGSFVFLGPTGVGKTELSKALAEAMFGDEDAIIRIDMSEYMEKHSVSKLIGSPPGYIGFEEGGQLTEKVRRKPYSVILFDEIEKAHPDVFNILLQLLDDGRMTDSKGRVVDFKNTLIIMTSNVGASTIKKQKTLGFSTGDEVDSEKNDYEKMKENVMVELKKTFRPEFLNRLDEIIVFHSLSKDNIKEIVNLMINNLQKKLAELGISIEVDEEAKAMLAEEGFDPVFGARPLQRTIRKRIEDSLSEEILRGTISKNDNILVKVEEQKLKLMKKEEEHAL